MHSNVDDLAVRASNEEATEAPGFIGDRMHDLVAASLGLFVRRVDVVDLDGHDDSSGAVASAAKMVQVTITSDPWLHPDPEHSCFRLVKVEAALLQALAEGEIKDVAGQPVTSYIAGDECVGLWRMRAEQLADNPTDAPWVTRLVHVPGDIAPVGLAGFHGAPDETGMVEVGYRIDPAHRRNGYAKQALETLLAVARDHADVRVVRATVSPDNAASRSLVVAFGFQPGGEQWDDEDGLEIIYEVAADASLPTTTAR